MFRAAMAMLMGAAIATMVSMTSINAQEKKAEKEVTIKGSITCAKCDLNLTSSCMTVIKDGDKVYYFDKAAHKKYHADTCQAAKNGTVTGIVGKDAKDKKKLTITVKELKYAD